jgi:hypothetical protein
MKATKDWGQCSCDCGKSINKGDEFVIIVGDMYLLGHDEKSKATQRSAGKKKKTDSNKTNPQLSLFDGVGE